MDLIPIDAITFKLETGVQTALKLVLDAGANGPQGPQPLGTALKSRLWTCGEDRIYFVELFPRVEFIMTNLAA